MRILIFHIIIISGLAVTLFAQGDTLISYDVRTKSVSSIPPPLIDPPDNSGFTLWSFGLITDIMVLDTHPPQNTYPNSGFTYFTKAHPQLRADRYPACTTVNLQRFYNGELQNWCTGTMISSNLVLTCAHGLWDQEKFPDSILAAPAYDNNSVNSNIGTSISKKFYIPKGFYDNTGWRDIGIIELNEPLGNNTGWMGIAYNDDPHFFDGRVLHKFSYPGNAYSTDHPSYNGDTLYYSYGTIDRYSLGGDLGLGYVYPSILGMSGSSLFHTDNSGYYIYGTLSASAEDPPMGPMTYHFPIKKNIFYVIKNIIDNTHSSIPIEPSSVSDRFILNQNFPNPFNPTTTIEYSIPIPTSVRLNITDVLGQELAVLVDELQQPGVHRITWDASAIPTGVYFCHLQAGSFSRTMKLLLLK